MKVMRRPDFRDPECGGFWITLLIYAALFVASELLRPKPNIENARAQEVKFPTASEARPVPLVWGTVRIDGPNVMWHGDVRQVPIYEKIKTGLFTSEKVVVGFQYKVGVQFGLCRGPIDAIEKVWVGQKEVFSGSKGDGEVISVLEPEFFGGSGPSGSGGLAFDMRVFGGTTTQTASSYLNSVGVQSGAVNAGGSGYAVEDVLTVVGGTGTAATFRVAQVSSGAVTDVELLDPGLYSTLPAATGAATTVAPAGGSGCTLDLTFGTRFSAESASGETPGYRGTCFTAPDSEPYYVGDSGSVQPFAFQVRRIPNGLGLTGGNDVVNGADCNPMNVLYELLTDDDWGLKQSASDIDVAGFVAAAATLKTEGNGFSMLLDRNMEAHEFKREVERQIDGVVYPNYLTGKWEVKLARFDYTVGTLPKITAGSGVEVRNFARGAWEDTTNILRVQFRDRSDDYKETFALAQDMGNLAIQEGQNVSATHTYPGVKDKTLANQIAWRDLRTLSFPLAKASLLVDRTHHDRVPGEVIAFSDPALGITDLPMRILRIDYGLLEEGPLLIDLVQDVFLFRAGSFAAPPASGWTEPVNELLPFLASQQLAFEIPRALAYRNPLGSGPEEDRVWTGARRRGAERSFRMVERHASGTPSGSYADAGETFGLLLIGELKNALAVGSPTPLTSLLLTADPDSQAELEAAFTDGTQPSSLGTNLEHLLYVGDDGAADGEYMVCEGAQTSGGDVQLDNVYRSMLDTVQQSHAAGTKVWLLFVGGGVTDVTFPATDNVDIKLLPKSGSDEVAEAAARVIQLTMSNRVRRPYPPSHIDLNSTEWDSTSVSLEGTGSGEENVGVGLALNRRDYRVAEGRDEVEMLTTDAALIDPTFPSANVTDHEVEVWDDPSGTPSLLFTVTFSTISSIIRRIQILRNLAGVIPSELRFVIRSRHFETIGGSVSQVDSRQDLTFDFTTATALTGDFNFGVLDNGDVSNLYTATVAGTYSFTLSSAFSSGDVEYRLNGGSWLQLIAGGGTGPGTIAGVVATDTIEIRHLSTDTNAEKWITMDAPGAGQDGYGILIT